MENLIAALRKQDREACNQILNNYNAMWAKDILRTIRRTQDVVVAELSQGLPDVSAQFLLQIREGRTTRGTDSKSVKLQCSQCGFRAEEFGTRGMRSCNACGNQLTVVKKFKSPRGIRNKHARTGTKV